MTGWTDDNSTVSIVSLVPLISLHLALLLQHLGMQQFYLEAERVTAVDSRTARALRQTLWPNNFVATMPWRTANLSRLLPAYRAKGLVPDAATLVQQCLESYQQAQALEDEHQRGMPQAPAGYTTQLVQDSASRRTSRCRRCKRRAPEWCTTCTRALRHRPRRGKPKAQRRTCRHQGGTSRSQELLMGDWLANHWWPMTNDWWRVTCDCWRVTCA